jgi:nitrogen fixation protein NifX
VSPNLSPPQSRSMTREAALRIGLAARELDLVSVAPLVQALASRVGLPLTEAGLSGVAVADLREIVGAGGSEELVAAHDGPPPEAFKRAARLLWGEGVEGSELPTIEPYREGDLPASLRVACASNSGENIDGHFGSCERFLVYQVTPDALRLIDARPTLAADHDEEDRNAARARLIGDCQLVYVQSIGGPAAAKVVRAGSHPVKVPQAGAARELLARLQIALIAPPPWLAKAMGVRVARQRYTSVEEE